MDQRRGSTPVYCVDYSKCPYSPMRQRKASTPLYKGCAQYLRGVYPPMNQHKECIPLYKGCVDYLKRLKRSINLPGVLVSYTRAILTS